MTTLAQAIQAAYDADKAYEAMLAKHKVNRYAVIPPVQHLDLQVAYWAKVDADKAMNEAFAESRRVAS